jgi:6-phosphogluconate dehydrogenase
MGRNLALNMADHGVAVAGCDKDPAKVSTLELEAEKRDIHGAADIRSSLLYCDHRARS